MHIITLTDRALADFLAEIRRGRVHTVRVAHDGDTVKFKINEGMWTPPYPIADEDARRVAHHHDAIAEAATVLGPLHRDLLRRLGDA